MTAPIEHEVSGPLEMAALRALAAGQDAFAGCQAAGDFARRLSTLALLRRNGWIDRPHQITCAGRAALAAGSHPGADGPGR